MLKQGAPARKLVLGLPMYGRTFLLENEDNPMVMDVPASPKGFPGPYTKEDGFMGYNEVSNAVSSYKQRGQSALTTEYNSRRNFNAFIYYLIFI